MLDKIIDLYKNSESTYDHTWVGSDPSKAFLICVASGPWKISRRKQVQEEALRWLGNEDLCNKIYPRRQLFPFKWQNDMLFSLITSLNLKYGIKFEDLCNKWKTNIIEYCKYTDKPIWMRNIEDFFHMCGKGPDGTKVLWMFVRDFLQLPAFPIDQHISKKLNEYVLPCNPWQMIRLCQKAIINPNELNRRLFSGRNPDWS